MAVAVAVVGAAAAADAGHAAAAAAHTRRLSSFGGLVAGTGASCAKAKPTLVLVSGVGGSQMSATSTGGGECPPLTNSTVIWFDWSWFLNRQMRCFGYYMSLNFDAKTLQFSNSTGTQLWADGGLLFGDFPKDSKPKAFYGVLWKHLKAAHGYVTGKDLFYIPYDWRIGVQGLEKSGGLQSLADRIARAVEINCGQKAIIMSHSYGANVMATILQDDKFAAWRNANVKAWIPIGAPFGGCAATTWLCQLSGDFFKLFPIVSNYFLPPSLTGKWHPTAVGKALHRLAFGWPTWGWMAPRPGVLGKDHVLIVTPTRNYTVEQQKQLMLDQGDVGGASMLEDSWARSEAILAKGPVPGIETYCLYGTDVPTSSTLVFNESVQFRAPITRPFEVLSVPGDGVVDTASLRLCSKLAPADHLVEVSAPLVDHATVLAHPLGLTKLSGILEKLGVPYSGRVAQWLGLAFEAAGAVTTGLGK